MIDGLEPYGEYRPSTHPWLGQVPAHWNEQRAKLFYREVDERSATGEEELMSVSHVTGVTPRKSNVTMFKAESTVGYKICRPGDIVINTMWAFMGALGVARQVGLVSPSYGVYRPHQHSQCMHPDYIDRLIRVEAYKSEYLCRSTGIHSSRLRLYPDQFLRIPLLCPPPEEQAAIVRFLDYIDRRVKRYIRSKRKLIALLNEQKQAIIHRAVTRGLNPNVPLKPSGVPWLGDVPEDWTLKRFKFISSIASGQVDPRKRPYRDMPLIAPNHIQSRTGLLLAVESAHEQGADSGKYLVRAGQIVYSKIRPNLRKAAIAPVDGLCSADMYPIEARRKELSPEFLLLLLLSEPFTRFAVDASMRVAMPKVNREALADCIMWYPDIPEQQKILQQMNIEITPIEAAIASVERDVNLIHEYRTTLTADAVTGKLDVREAAAALPDELEAIEPDAEELLDNDEATGDVDSEPEEVEA